MDTASTQRDPNTLTSDQLSYWVCRLKPSFHDAKNIAQHLASEKLAAANLIEPLRRNGFGAGDIAAALASAYQMKPWDVAYALANARYDTGTVADCLRFNLQVSLDDTAGFLINLPLAPAMQGPDVNKTYFIVPATGLSCTTRLLSVHPDNTLGFVDKDDGSGRQLWRFTDHMGPTSGYYTISPLTCGWPNGGFLSCHEVDGSPPVNLTTNDIYDKDDTSGRQRWTLGAVGDGSFNLTIEQPGALKDPDYKYLSCAKDGSAINLWHEDDQSGRQQWRLLQWPATDSTEYVIQVGAATAAGTFLSCAGGYPPTDPVDGYPQGLALRPAAIGEAQHWTFEWIGEGWGYRIRPVLGLACLSCNGNPNGEADLWYTDDNSGRQRWILTPISPGTFTFTIEWPGALQDPTYKYLSCSIDGTALNLWNADDQSGRQHWTVQAAAPVGPPFQLPSYVTSAGYDLVCAVTQQNLENTLQQHALDLNTPEFSAYYGPSGALSADTVKGWLGQTDLFALAAGPIPANVLPFVVNQGLSWAFKATPFTADKHKPKRGQFKVIALDQGPSSVRHQLSFKEFTLVWFAAGTLNVFTQDPDNPVVFSSRHDLQVGDADFSALPADSQASLKAQHPGALFSLKQLFLDLSNSTLIDVVPPLDGVPNAQDKAAAIVSQYWQQVPASATVLGYSVGLQAAGSGTPGPSITPTALGFVVSPHLGPDGKADGNLNLNTLNYLVMSGNRALPAASPFAWNWVESDSIGGVMSVRGGIFTGFLTQLLNALPATANLCIQPGILDDGTGSFPDSTSPASWSADNNGVQSIQFATDNNGTADLPGGASDTSTWDIHYAMTGSITPGSSTFTLSLNVVVHVHLHNARFHFNAAGGPHGGYWTYQDLDCKIVDSTLSAQYTLTVGPAGQLIATPPNPLPSVVDNSETPDASWPFSAFTVGLQTKVQGTVTDAINGCANAIQGALSSTSPSDWVFPVGGTFSPSGVTLPFCGDLTVDISYTADPN